ncbi:MAG: osmoprotectant transport system substrate-binding protein [Nocardioidaceae bacterium]|jgi:osmoprotectant transport system substrate-binding protein|nr:osmoprotectant transport system substrate-binding protein [Nocardioidaceae bacterium]
MKSFSRAGRTLGTLAAVSMAVTLAACGSSNNSSAGGSSSQKSSSASSASSSGSSSGSSSAASPSVPTGTGNATLPSGQPGKGKPAIVMGDKNFSEEYLLGELYSQALRARGYTVTLKGNIGSSTTINAALQSGKIDMYPEYTGVVYTVLAGHPDNPTSATETLKGATAYENKHGYVVLNPTPFQDADGLATTKAFAQKNSLKAIGDLKNVSSFTYAGPPENATRYQGVVGLHKAYGLTNFKFKPVPIGSQYQALDQGKVDTIAIFTTDGQLASGKYAVLTDDKGIFGFQQVVPVVKKSVLSKEGPEFEQTLNAVSKLLTTDAVVAMNKAVQIDQQDPGEVAKKFLQANNLL